MQVTIPNTHLDLFQRPVHGVLTTMMPDGMPQSSIVWVEVRGQVQEMTRDRAEVHADKLTQRYCPGKHYFYGDIYPPEQKEKETRVIVKIEPIKVSLDAVFR